MTFVCSRFIYELTEIEPRLPDSFILNVICHLALLFNLCQTIE